MNARRRAHERLRAKAQRLKRLRWNDGECLLCKHNAEPGSDYCVRHRGGFIAQEDYRQP